MNHEFCRVLVNVWAFEANHFTELKVKVRIQMNMMGKVEYFRSLGDISRDMSRKVQ
jgi:hypothetical protein